MISVPWLCCQLLGELLSSQFISNARATGVYSPDDFQATFTCCDALDLLQLLDALHFCIQVSLLLNKSHNVAKCPCAIRKFKMRQNLLSGKIS